ncbi:alpha-D-ribose 1-methylphosphonate 5-triphosphate diphosphatase [Gloeocapsopsis sp. IPPAS B-1203]|uniref:alpha-D-ribose 1-methylphosphonate 5-triphosphate diphosphatase n=1 Tax=Gloeocapsopsis sp. IPPAS B-1203 TaxID=2049454 RepID=UPI000C180E21|nr:alpha-D-ribose 1-methylphosphonate 5-triphosphate diphosphatase [Gloeocapsopsis sp. IPPAS B-1203]PIG95414.1 phosphonate metabolism protein PhnM [Gloeocapsopsis sp. IPPAS B-1203]
MNEQIYTNYRLQLPEQEILGTLVVRDRLIADIQPGVVAIGQDGGGDYLLPGLIELHTDNLECCVSPRPGVRWSVEAAAAYHDRATISAGITTVCDAIAVGSVNSHSLRLTHFAAMIDAIYHGQVAGVFVAEHRLHLRCELSYDQAYYVAAQYADCPLLSLISLMDHAPGDRQFVRTDKFEKYYVGKYGVAADRISTLTQIWQQEHHHHASVNRTAIAQLAQLKGITLASHDDTTVSHIQQAVQDQVAIAEFPTTLAAAKAAKSSSLQVLVGAPNVVLGGSQSGNVAAKQLVEQSLVDIISSDYAPQSLLHAIFLISRYLNQPIYKVMRLATSNPAQAIHLQHDRGSLAIGKRADLIAVRDRSVPQLTAVICRGNRVA